ncbi:phytoene/squalene synthase family protein [bacterium]|nr:phytoene/squalene synthase family protein [bacterium]
MIPEMAINDYVRKAGSSFYYPMLMLPREKRDALMTVYAFCRYTDDMVDNAAVLRQPYNPVEFLQHWRSELKSAIQGHSKYPFLNKLIQVARKFSIPFELFFELISGVELDLKKNRYSTFTELYDYCYKVASTVGLMCIRIMGKRSESVQAYAVHLGIAMQLTNIVRDVASDFQRNRIYLPIEEMSTYGISELNFNDRSNPEAFKKLIDDQCRRAREYYNSADQFYKNDQSYLLFPARAMQNIYFRLLQKIETSTHEILHRKIRLHFPEKFSILFNTWMEERRHGG